jgi:hypothetical protein
MLEIVNRKERCRQIEAFLGNHLRGRTEPLMELPNTTVKNAITIH